MKLRLIGRALRGTVTAVPLALLPVVLAAQEPLRVQSAPITELKLYTAGAPPSGLVAKPSPTSVGLTWNCPANATGFDVFVTPRGGVTTKLNATPISAQCVQNITLQVDPRLPAPTETAYSTGYSHGGIAPATELTYLVRALYSGAFADAAPMTVLTPLWPAATGFATSLVSRSARLQWTPVTGAPGYLVFRNLQGQRGFQQIASAPAGAGAYSDATILPPGQHSYYVQTVTGQPTTAATVLLPPWPAPAGFSATLSARSAGLAWTPIAGAPGYLVFRQLLGQAGFQQITAAPLTAALFQDVGLPVGTHRYYVQAVGGEVSPTVSVIAGAPTNVDVAIYPGKPTVDFRWGGTADASSITLLRATTPAGPYTDVTKKGNILNDWGRDNAAQVNATQYYKIVAVYLSHGAMESSLLTATIPVGPQGITNLTATSPGPGTAKIKWTCDPKATGYWAMRGKGLEPMDGIKFTMTVPCEFIDTKLWDGATYRYVIVATYAEKNTSSSGDVSVTIAP